jgi:hypothetical protein
MAMCDASVRGVTYEIDLAVHHSLGTRDGDETIPASF